MVKVWLHYRYNSTLCERPFYVPSGHRMEKLGFYNCDKLEGHMVGLTDGHATAWATRTYSEINDIASKKGSVLLIPVGSLEQHGHHLPVGTDTMLVETIASEGSELVDDRVPILRTPTVWSGYSPHHTSFGGTISLKVRELLTMLESVADSGIEIGFDAVLLLNGHGGNISLIDNAVSTIGASSPEIEALGVTYFQLAPDAITEIRDSDIGGMSHGGEFETSLMLHLFPEMVREDRTATTGDEPYDHGSVDLLESEPLAIYRSFEEYSATGAIGDPELASAEKGERIYTTLTTELAELLYSISAANTDR